MPRNSLTLRIKEPCPPQTRKAVSNYSLAIPTRPTIIALVRTTTLLEQIRENLGHRAFTSCLSVATADIAFDESSPAIVIFETGIWSATESSRLIALLARAVDCTVFVFWRQGSTALAELTEVARTAKNVHSIHENYSLTPLNDVCLGQQRTVGILERVRDKLADEGQSETFCSLLVAALSLMPEASSVGQFAAAVGMGQGKLRSGCRRAGLPTPVNLLGWARAIHVVDGLASDRRLGAHEFRVAGKTGKNCAEYVRFHTGKGPHSWLASGGVDALMEAFLFALQKAFDESPVADRRISGVENRPRAEY